MWGSIMKDTGRPGVSKSTTSEEQQSIRELHCELQASPEPPDLNQ